MIIIFIWLVFLTARPYIEEKTKITNVPQLTERKMVEILENRFHLIDSQRGREILK